MNQTDILELCALRLYCYLPCLRHAFNVQTAETLSEIYSRDGLNSLKLLRDAVDTIILLLCITTSILRLSTNAVQCPAQTSSTPDKFGSVSSPNP